MTYLAIITAPSIVAAGAIGFAVTCITVLLFNLVGERSYSPWGLVLGFAAAFLSLGYFSYVMAGNAPAW